MPNGVRHIILLFLGEGVPPISEFIDELDFPRHTYSMPYTEYSLGPRKFMKNSIGSVPGFVGQVPDLP